MIGETVKYNGFKTTTEGHTVASVCFGTCIGYDDLFIYTKIVTPKDEYTQHQKWDESLNCSHIVQQFRTGFNRSRLIGVVKEFKKLPGNLSQTTLF